MVYCIYCGLNRLELQAKHQLHGRAPVPAARLSLFTLFNYLEFSWAIRRAHDVQTLLRTRESTARSPPRTNPLKTVEGPACSGEHCASGRTRLGELSSGRGSGRAAEMETSRHYTAAAHCSYYWAWPGSEDGIA
jgi:hypothetical protein